MNKKSEIDLNRLISDYPALCNWKNNADIRKPPKELNKSRLSFGSFDISELTNFFSGIKQINGGSLRILFAHFSPFEWELEALGLPSYASKALPSSIIDITYDKGGKQAPCFRVAGNTVTRRQRIEESYDIVIARSSVLNNMTSRKQDRKCLENSGYIVNVKTMSYSPNYQHADYYFDEEDMCPPPDPIYTSRSNNFLKQHNKEKLIVVSGTLWYVKNQLKMFQQLDSSVIKDYRVIIMGPERDHRYVSSIMAECEKKSIPYYLIGSVCRKMANDIKSLSKISIIPMDMRVFGQPKGYPRTMGESVGSKCLTLCNAPVTVPSFYMNTCRVYDEANPASLNEQLDKCIADVETNNFLSTHNWGEKSFEDVCEITILKCMQLAGVQ